MATVSQESAIGSSCPGSCPVIEVSIRAVAKRCVFIIRGCLREEEWIDAEEEFRRIILEGLKDLLRCEFSPSNRRASHGVAQRKTQPSSLS